MDSPGAVHEFGPFRFHADDGTLLRDGATISLTPRAATLLAVLVQNQGRVVTREELERRVWGDTFVDGNNLHQQIAALRRILGPDAAQWIETIPRRGYRLNQPLSPLSPPQRGESRGEGSSLSRRLLFTAIAAALTLVILASCILLYERRKPVEPIRADSIAVLPLKPLTRSAADDYLRLGVTDSLISRLGGLRVIDVRPLSAVGEYGTLTTDAVTAGRRLHVDTVLDGTTQRAGDRVRLTLRLVDVTSGRQLWSAIYDEPIDDIFSVEDRISRAVVDVLSLRLHPLSAGKRAPSVDPYVVEMYLRGRYHFSRRTTPDLTQSIAEFQKALARDPQFAPAWAGLADSLNFNGRVAEARNALSRALALDPSLADAHATLGNLLFFNDRDLPAAERAFQRAIELNPSCTNARHWYAYLLAVRGRMPDAMRELQAARRIDPLSLPINTSVGTLLYLDGRFDEAIAAYQQAGEIDPHFVQAQLELGLTYAAKGDMTRAEAALRRSGVTDLRNPDDVLTAYALARRGERVAAVRALRRAAEQWRAKQSGAAAIWIAATHVALGEKNAALEWLARAIETHDGNVVLIGIDPKFRALRADERFRELLRRASLA